jgi:hypothetical protein
MCSIFAVVPYQLQGTTSQRHRHLSCQQVITDIFLFFYFYVRYSTLLRLPPLRLHCVGGCWDRTQDNRTSYHYL